MQKFLFWRDKNLEEKINDKTFNFIPSRRRQASGLAFRKFLQFLIKKCIFSLILSFKTSLWITGKHKIL